MATNVVGDEVGGGGVKRKKWEGEVGGWLERRRRQNKTRLREVKRAGPEKPTCAASWGPRLTRRRRTSKMDSAGESGITEMYRRQETEPLDGGGVSTKESNASE
jgi:hypothetical protein